MPAPAPAHPKPRWRAGQAPRLADPFRHFQTLLGMRRRLLEVAPLGEGQREPRARDDGGRAGNAEPRARRLLVEARDGAGAAGDARLEVPQRVLDPAQGEIGVDAERGIADLPRDRPGALGEFEGLGVVADGPGAGARIAG